ncbi:MAG TPA: helix-turn-helix transcriptional regulator [Ktedonobacteraceae bacterium]|nr:helix-turn-helix transcriptional regulator [Ktedonobacteraceae bacterium]
MGRSSRAWKMDATISLDHGFEREQPARIGNRLAVLRREQGWSRQEIADMLSIHPATLAELENGSYLPSLPLVLRLSELFQLPVDTLFFLNTESSGSDTDVTEGVYRCKSTSQY